MKSASRIPRTRTGPQTCRLPFTTPTEVRRSLLISGRSLTSGMGCINWASSSFASDKPAIVEIGTSGTDGYVIADAVQLTPVKDHSRWFFAENRTGNQEAQHRDHTRR